MSSGNVQIAPDSTGKKIDTSELLVGTNVVQRQRIVISDDSSADALAKVSAADPVSSSPGLVTRDVLAPELRDLAEAVAYLATCIHDRLPMPDSNERMRVYLDSSSGASVNLQLAAVANPVTFQPVYLQHMPSNMMAMDAARLYQMIEVS